MSDQQKKKQSRTQSVFKQNKNRLPIQDETCFNMSPHTLDSYMKFTPDLLDRLTKKIHDTGFDIVKITRLQDHWKESNRLKHFITAGYHGDMHWMETTFERRRHPKALWKNAKTAIVLGLNYAPPINPLKKTKLKNIGNISVYAQNDDYHDVIKKRLKACAQWLRQELNSLNQSEQSTNSVQKTELRTKNDHTVSPFDSNACSPEIKVFVDTAPLMEKPLAELAGMGWQGKHTNLVNREYGSWLFLGVILTNLVIDITDHTPTQKKHCGRCQKCLDICPTNAFIQPYQIDARRCISYLTIEHKEMIPVMFRRAIGNRIYGCDDCLAICPWNKFAKTSKETVFHARIELQYPLLSELIELDDQEFRKMFSKSPIKRIGRNRFIRNVLIAIGNTNHPKYITQIIKKLHEPSWIVRASAVWALKCLSEDLFKKKKQAYIHYESHNGVRQEWESSIS